MNVNALLLWMSARRHGSWPQFRAAVEELKLGEGDKLEEEADEATDPFSLPLYQALRFNLQRVGHAEFFAGAGAGADWRVTPPTLAVMQRASSWIGIVVGARSSTLVERIRSATVDARYEAVSLAGYPDQILISADDQSILVALAKQAGLFLQLNAPAALLACLPAVDDTCVRYQTEIPIGAEWKIDRFSPDELGWRSATRSDVASHGLFRFSLRHQTHILYCRMGDAFRVPGQVGKYLVLKGRRQVLNYDENGRSLAMPAICCPPFLIERALILCSGHPPSYDGTGRRAVLRYQEISQTIALSTAALLHQELK